MRGVVVRTVYSARDKHLKRRLYRSKASYLPGGGVRSEHEIVVYIESVLLISRGMLLGSVERGEVVEIVLDFSRL